MKRVCVIGGAGFLGSHVADALSAAGHHVRIYDRKASDWLHDSQEMIIGDMLDSDSLRNTTDGARYIYHYGRRKARFQNSD